MAFPPARHTSSSLPDALRNNYFALRHGHSVANERGIVASSLEVARHDFGLTDLGRRQVTATVEQAHHAGILDAQTLIYASPLLRTRQTATLARAVLGAERVRYSARLRERFFGEFDGGQDARYNTIWRLDAEDAQHRQYDVESVTSVLRRTTQLIRALEQRFMERRILLVSHGDTLQILRTAFLRDDPGNHRSAPTIATGELTQLTVGVRP